MPPSETNTVKIVVIGLLACVVVAAGAYSLWRHQQKGTSQNSQGNSAVKPIHSFGGTLLEINGTTLSVRSIDPIPNALVPRNVIVSSKTEIIKWVPKNKELYQKELAEFQRLISQPQSRSATTIPRVPYPYVTEAVTMSVLGTLSKDTILQIESDANIADAMQFEARRIFIHTESTLK